MGANVLVIAFISTKWIAVSLHMPLNNWQKIVYKRNCMFKSTLIRYNNVNNLVLVLSSEETSNDY